MGPRSAGSGTRWVWAVRAGAEASGTAMRNLWNRYSRKLEKAAGVVLENRPVGRAVADEEDVAQDGFLEIWSRLSDGAYPTITNRLELWKLLVTITKNKARTQARNLGRQVRGGGRVLHAGDLGSAATNGGEFAQIADPTPDPLERIIQAEAYRQRLDQLGDDPALRSVVRMKLEGYSTEEIAKKLGRHPRTIERKLEILRKKLAGEPEP
jgi:RNA polymerase sigma factor (sigma-70 family)